jgi:hypothetical protein
MRNIEKPYVGELFFPSASSQRKPPSDGHVSLKEISGFQPNLAAALAGFPSRVSTFAGL